MRYYQTVHVFSWLHKHFFTLKTSILWLIIPLMSFHHIHTFSTINVYVPLLHFTSLTLRTMPNKCITVPQTQPFTNLLIYKLTDHQNSYTYGLSRIGAIFIIAARKSTSLQKNTGFWGWLITLKIRNSMQIITAIAAKSAVDMFPNKRSALS